jgi:AraC-like DNA-binding protein
MSITVIRRNQAIARYKRLVELNPMIPEVFDTRSLAVSSQFQGWRAWNMPVLDVTSQVPTSDGFPARNQVWTLDDGLLVATATAPAACTVRSPRLLRQMPVDHWVVSHTLRGTVSMETARRTVEIRTGQTFVMSLGQTASIKRTQIDRVDLLLSRDRFRDIAPLLDRVTGSVLDSTLGHFLGSFLVALVRRLPRLPESDAPRLTVAVSKLIAACIAPSAGRLDAGGGCIEIGLLERVRQTVRNHLQSPHLGPRMLSRQVGMSRSNLYRLLESEGGVMSYIARHRLTEARSRLADSRNIQTIASIAYDVGFADPSTFSRAFRAMFGVSPGEIRAAVKKLDAPHPIPLARSGQTNTRFVDLLRHPMPRQHAFADQTVRSAAAAQMGATIQ